MLPYLFSSMAMGAVGRAAKSMIEEVRRQFATIPALKEALGVLRKYDGDTSNATEEDRKILENAEGSAEYEKCVEISTKASLREMILPGLVAVLAPGVIGFIGGAEMLGGMLAGVMASGVLLAIYQSNAGGAWDNAKKMVEEGIDIEDETHSKGSESHKATVVGDTVGDPFKDTSGPSLNILIKLMSVVALVLAPTFAMDIDSASDEVNETRKEIIIEPAENNEEASITFPFTGFEEFVIVNPEKSDSEFYSMEEGAELAFDSPSGRS
jgi:K(+)-stimulated pyrophosphate-energized sodium pump